LQLDDLPRQLALVASLAQQHHVTIDSLVTLRSFGADQREPRLVVLRVGSMVVRRFVDALRQAGIAVDRPEFDNG
jgi:hypothetical protein